MAANTRRGGAPAVSPAQQYARAQQHAELLRLGVLGIILGLLVFPWMPPVIAGVSWRASLGSVITPIFTPIPPVPIDLVIITIPPIPGWQWIYWALAGWLGLFAVSCAFHLILIYRQRTLPLIQTRTYLRVRVPASSPPSHKAGIPFLRELSPLLPPTIPAQPRLPPLMLCWTGRPEQRVQQGVSIAGPATLRTVISRALHSLAPGTQVQEWDDPLLAACAPGRWLGIATGYTTAGKVLPIAPLGASPRVQEALLNALQTQTGVLATSFRVSLEPMRDTSWRRAIVALIARAKLDTASADDRAALETRAAGPMFRCCVTVYAIAEDPSAARLQLETIGGALAGTAQAYGATTQQLRLTGFQMLPATLPEARAASRGVCVLSGLIGLLSGLGSALLVFPRFGATPVLSGLLVVLIAVLASLVVMASWRASVRADAWMVPRAALLGMHKPLNPRVIPIWWPWFGYRG